MNRRLEGKVAVVTGCGSSGPGWGNGKAIATLLSRMGASVFGCDVNLAAASETKELIDREGGRIQISGCDVADPLAVEGLIKTCIETYGDIDILVNNVGIARLGGAVELDLADWRMVMDVNVTSMFLTAKYTIPSMLRKGSGSIVNIGSVAGVRDSGVPYISYSASKAAVLGLSRSIAMQYAKNKIRSNVLMPGLMNTPMIQVPSINLSAGYKSANVEEMLEKRNQQCPTGEMGDAWDVAYTTLWLASDEAKYITAAEIVVDGGLTARV
ncbi:MAG: SDR family oxidoreductase [Burkholderiaceae bacterium]|nr:SDR family oxidoreductase [Burkholderiaceae bacterium]MEB2317863.1 SDR family NAD(P)-dependent oxidoreductase [Pseudomonadota bacterium]